MRRRHVLIIRLVAPMVIAAGLLWTFWFLQDPITSANYQRMRRGMTEEAVVSLLGRERDDDVTDVRGTWARWTGRQGSIHVSFVDGRVDYAEFAPDLTPPGWLGRILGWLGL